MPSATLSPQAARSLADIDDYTSKQFGPLQAVRYLENLLDRIEYLAEDPTRGKKRDDLTAGIFSYFVDSHTVYYRIAANHIEVIDILHQSMEPKRHLPE